MHPLLQPLPPLPGSGGIDIGTLALNMLLAVIWSIVTLSKPRSANSLLATPRIFVRLRCLCSGV